LPHRKPTLDRLRDFCLISLLVLAAGWNFAAFRGYVFEDAYITFRYAAHLAAGQGFVFQPGDRVLGTSTPLLTLLLGLFGALGIDIPAAGKLLSALALSACGGLGFLLLARRGSPNAGAIFAAIAVSGASGVLSLSGMETGLHLALVFLAAWLASEERPLLTGIVLGLICLNRYDGVMMAAAVLLTLLILRRRLPWKEALVSGVMLGGWLLFAQLYFGGILPNTYAAKAADVDFATYATESLKIQAQGLPRPLYRLNPPLRWWPSLWQQIALVLALPLFWWAGSLPKKRRGPSPPCPPLPADGERGENPKKEGLRPSGSPALTLPKVEKIGVTVQPQKVTPAKAGAQSPVRNPDPDGDGDWAPAFAGVTTEQRRVSIHQRDPAARANAAVARGLDLLPLAFFALFLWLGYSAIGPPLGHTWYLIPATYALLALSLAGWAKLLARVPPRWAAAAALLVLAATLAILPWAVRREAGLITSVDFGNDRVLAYEEMAGFVLHHGLEDSTLLTNEPGYLTYLSGQRAIDTAGLVTRDLFFHGPQERRSDPYRLLETRQPEMALLGSPITHEGGLREGSYLLALAAAPGRNLWIRRDFFRRHLERLHAAWQKIDYRPASPAPLRHPIAIEFGVTDPPHFYQRGTTIGVLDPAFAAGEVVLHSRGQRGAAAAWSEPFAIDFDQLDFQFSANHEFLTAAQLFVDGLLVYEVTGRQRPGGPRDLGPLEQIELPLYAWRGRQGALFFLSAEGERGEFAADRVESKVFSRSRSFDDFETGAYSPAIWEKGFGRSPQNTREIASFGGLGLVQGNFAAASFFAAGSQEMVSKSFPIDHARMSFTVFDFGDGRTRVELRVGGHRKHFYAGQGRGRTDLVTWDLSQLQGREAVLIVRDEIPAAEKGIGIDSILLYDP
jgi:hypothetical protein